jgi:triphosphoribosyl-dephospho-CoA synthase
MALAADRDRVARQYADAYAEVFDEIVPDLVEYLHLGVEQAVCHARLRQLARHGDSLITRKPGFAVNDEAKRRGTRR